MEPNEWLGCDLLESVPGKVSDAVVFKGMRLPVETITDNLDAYMELDNQSLDEAISSTLESFPDTPGGADAIRQVLAYREAHEHQLQPWRFCLTKVCRANSCRGRQIMRSRR